MDYKQKYFELARFKLLELLVDRGPLTAAQVAKITPEFGMTPAWWLGGLKKLEALGLVARDGNQWTAIDSGDFDDLH